MTATIRLGTHPMRPADLARLSVVGMRTRKLRAALSALGIALGVAAIVAVLGLSSSSQAGLLNEISQLGTNLLTVANGQTLSGEAAELPVAAPGMIARSDGPWLVRTACPPDSSRTPNRLAGRSKAPSLMSATSSSVAGDGSMP